MKRAAVNFEYEWMKDGSLRVRFLNEADTILGQQFIAPEGLVPLHLLTALAHAQSSDASFSFVRLLLDAARVRVGLTPDGLIDLKAIEGE